MAHGYFSIFTQHAVKQQQSFAHMASPDKIQHGNHHLDNHHQSFGSWSITWVNVSWLRFSWAQQSISMHDAIQLVNVWNSNLVFVQPGAKINIVIAYFNKDYCQTFVGYQITTSRFRVMERQHRHTVQATLSLTHAPMCPSSLNWITDRQTVWT